QTWGVNQPTCAKLR
ncbi:mutS domain III family protein, partial [Vibrio parahaemolyticus VP2007-007]